MKITRRFFLLAVLGVWGFFSVAAFAEEVPVDENLFVVLSDVHIHQEPIIVDPGLEFDTQANFRRCVREVLEMNPRPVAVIILGDLQHRGVSDEPYQIFRELLKPWDEAGIRYFLTLGNHDQPARFFKNFPEWKDKMVAGAAWSASFKNVDFITLETTNYKEGGGFVPPAQREWMNDLLAKETKPVFICGHHGWKAMREKPDMTNPYIQAWMCGHFHNFKFIDHPEEGVREIRIPTTAHSGGPNSGYVILRVEEDGFRFTYKPLRDDSQWIGREIFLKKK